MKYTGYKDSRGKPIHEGDVIERWMPSPWDEEQPIRRTFKVIRDYGSWFAQGIQGNDEDDFLREHSRHCEVVEP